MLPRLDHSSKPSARGVRWGVYIALVGWAIITWDKPERVMFPAILGVVILAISFYLEGRKSR
jgi:hypothetical protein